MSFILAMILAVTVLILLLLTSIAINLRALRYELLPDLQSALMRQPVSRVSFFEPNGNFHHSGGPLHRTNGLESAYHVTWSWQGGRWNCEDVPPGMDPGLPPDLPGAYEGEYARVEQV
jgi:hypothetical protein